MAQQFTNSFISTNIPGAYPNITVQSNPVGLAAAAGIVLIFGEADGGPSYETVALKNNTFTPDQLAKIQSKYISGQIVDAFTALAAPSNDPDIVGSANLIYVIKTNTGTQASAIVESQFATAYGTLKDLNWGLPGNLYKYQILSINAEMAPTVSGNTIPALGAPLNGDSFTLRMNGGAESIVTLSGTSGDHDTIPHLINELNQYTFTVTAANATAGATYTNNGQTFTVISTIVAGTTLLANGTGAPAVSGTLTKVTGAGDTTIAFSAESRKLPDGVSASAGTAPSSIDFTMSPDSDAFGEGWGKSMELIDSTPGDLLALGLTAGLYVSSQEPQIEVDIDRPDINVAETLDVTPNIALTIGYAGTTATMTISGTTLSTTVTGGSGANLSIPLAQYTTILTLAGFINSQTGYTATATPAAQQLPTSALDQVTAIGIAATGAGDQPGRVKDSAATFQKVLATSTSLSFTPGVGGTTGLPAPMATPVFLAGGTRGATAGADIVNALIQAAGVQVNIIVPLFSQDATADIVAGTTDPASTYTINAINAATKSHCIEFSTPSLKHNRTCMLSYNNTYANCKAQAQSLGNYRCSLTMQQVVQVNTQAVITTYLPWYASCIAAGMQTGGFYKAIVNKAANVISFIDPAGFDSGDPGDVQDALEAGLLFLSADTAREYWVSDQTTYGLDSNFVYNSIQAVYASDILALDLAQNFFVAFVGKSLADVDAATGLAYLAQLMAGYRSLKLIAGSSDAPLGWKNASIQIQGPVMSVQVEIKLATSIYFIPISINISEIQSAA